MISTPPVARNNKNNYIHIITSIKRCVLSLRPGSTRAVEAFLIDFVQNALHRNRVHLALLLVLVRQLLLRSAIDEERMVRHHCKIKSIMSQKLIELLGFGLRPLLGTVFVVEVQAECLLALVGGEFGHFVNDMSERFWLECVGI